MFVNCRQKSVTLWANEWRMRQVDNQQSIQNKLLSVALLLAMMPMLITSALHVHGTVFAVDSDLCELCVSSVPHNAHIDSYHTHSVSECVQCNLLSGLTLLLASAGIALAVAKAEHCISPYFEHRVRKSATCIDYRGPPYLCLSL